MRVSLVLLAAAALSRAQDETQGVDGDTRYRLFRHADLDGFTGRGTLSFSVRADLTQLHGSPVRAEQDGNSQSEEIARIAVLRLANGVRPLRVEAFTPTHDPWQGNRRGPIRLERMLFAAWLHATDRAMAPGRPRPLRIEIGPSAWRADVATARVVNSTPLTWRSGNGFSVMRPIQSHLDDTDFERRDRVIWDQMAQGTYYDAAKAVAQKYYKTIDQIVYERDGIRYGCADCLIYVISH